MLIFYNKLAKAANCGRLINTEEWPSGSNANEYSTGFKRNPGNTKASSFLSSRSEQHGRVAEWLKARLSKSRIPLSGIVGSNPTSSAKVLTLRFINCGSIRRFSLNFFG